MPERSNAYRNSPPPYEPQGYPQRNGNTMAPRGNALPPRPQAHQSPPPQYQPPQYLSRPQAYQPSPPQYKPPPSYQSHHFPPSAGMVGDPKISRPQGPAPMRPPSATLTPTTSMGTFAANQPLTNGLQKLSEMRDSRVKPVAESSVLASMNLAAGLQTTGVKVPEMNVSVTCSDPKLLAHYGGGRENIVLQRLQMKAFEAIQQSSREVKAAITDFDQAMAKNPPRSKLEADQRQATFDNVCRSIVAGQQAKIDHAVQQEWGMQKQRDTALMASNVRFGVKVTMQAVSLSANVAATVALPGINVISPVKGAYTVYRMAETVKKFAQDRDHAAKSIVKNDAALVALQASDDKGGAGEGGWRTRAREMVGAAHIPFTTKMFKSVHNHEQKLDEFLAKSARVDRDARKMYAEANQLMKTLENAPPPFPGAPDPHGEMRKEVGELLTALGELMQSVQVDNDFYNANKERCKAFRANQPVGTQEQSHAVDMTATAVRVGRFAGNVAKIATHLTPV